MRETDVKLPGTTEQISLDGIGAFNWSLKNDSKFTIIKISIIAGAKPYFENSISPLVKSSVKLVSNPALISAAVNGGGLGALIILNDTETTKPIKTIPISIFLSFNPDIKERRLIYYMAVEETVNW